MKTFTQSQVLQISGATKLTNTIRFEFKGMVYVVRFGNEFELWRADINSNWEFKQVGVIK